ncbi:MAG: hypothetical protein V1245_05935, partial [Arenicellales bacterium]|nr:hypothetical protein [Arenicellales bacterium]
MTAQIKKMFARIHPGVSWLQPWLMASCLLVLVTAVAIPAFAAGDAERGAEIYTVRCALCHGD